MRSRKQVREVSGVLCLGSVAYCSSSYCSVNQVGPFEHYLFISILEARDSIAASQNLVFLFLFPFGIVRPILSSHYNIFVMQRQLCILLDT